MTPSKIMRTVQLNLELAALRNLRTRVLAPPSDPPTGEDMGLAAGLTEPLNPNFGRAWSAASIAMATGCEADELSRWLNVGRVGVSGGAIELIMSMVQHDLDEQIKARERELAQL